MRDFDSFFESKSLKFFLGNNPDYFLSLSNRAILDCSDYLSKRKRATWENVCLPQQNERYDIAFEFWHIWVIIGLKKKVFLSLISFSCLGVGPWGVFMRGWGDALLS